MSVLEVNSLCKRFGRQQAVRDISFRVERGQVFGLLGPNGSGKTTTIACALGLLRPDSGSSTVLGLRAADIALTRGKLGAVFDQDNLIGALSVRANLEYARRLLGHSGGRDCQTVLEMTGIGQLAGRRASKLSLGQKKRVALARALLGKPELLVLDEPLSALDSMGVNATLELIRELARAGLGVLLSSHRLHEMQQVISHAVVLAGGRCVAQGALHELIGTQACHYHLTVLDVADGAALGTWMQQNFSGLECKALPSTQTDQTRFELHGDGTRDFGARLCAALCGQGFKIHALVPYEHNLATFFEDIVAHPGEQA